MKNLSRYETYIEPINCMSDIRKAKDGYLIHIKDLRKYLKSFDSTPEIKEIMNYIIHTQLEDR